MTKLIGSCLFLLVLVIEQDTVKVDCMHQQQQVSLQIDTLQTNMNIMEGKWDEIEMLIKQLEKDSL